MKAFTLTAFARLLSTLPNLQGRLHRWVQSVQPHARDWALQSIAEIGSITSIPFVYSWVFDRDEQVADEAEIVLSGLTARFGETGWRSLESVMRSSAAGIYLNMLRPEDLERLKRFGDRQSRLLGLASFHPNGYVREAAVKNLADVNSHELPFLLMRLNDWVMPVHREALTACRVRLTPEYASRFIVCLPYIVALREARRHNLEAFIKDVEELLQRPECRPALSHGLDSSNPTIRRACFRLAFASVGENVGTIYDKAFRCHDPIVRREAAHRIRSRPAGDPIQVALLPRLRDASQMTIRREYLYLMHEKYPDQAVSALRDSLLDPHSSVREAARYYSKLLGQTDFRQVYLSALDVPEAPLLAAVAGLGETGRPEDAARIAGLRLHVSADVRRATVTALGKLDGDRFLPQLLDALNDPRARVSRAACDSLLPRISGVDDSALWSVWEKAMTSRARAGALRLMLALPKWRAGVLLTRAFVTQGTDAEDAKKVQYRLSEWLARFNRSAARPTRQQLAQIRQALEDASIKFPVDMATNLRDIVLRSEAFVL